jgi:hypothetical protein
MKCTWVRYAVAAVLLLTVIGPVPASERAAAAPETILSPDSVLFLRFHGMAKCQAAYDKTAWAEVMRGELGQFIDHCIAIAVRAIDTEMAKAGGRDGGPEMARLKAFLPHVRPLLKQLEQQGFLIGVDIKGVEPPQANLLLVLPNANNPAAQAGIDSLTKLISTAGKIKIQASAVSGREVSTIASAEMPLQVSWWMEGNHFVLLLGTDKADAVISRIEATKGESAGLLGNPLYKQVSGFKAYTSCADGFVDMRKALAVLTKAVPESAPFVDQLGLNGLKSIQIHMGYQERMNRTTYVFDIDGPRKGLLQVLMPGAPFELSQLPPIPPDVTSVTMAQLDLGASYDLIKGIALQAAKLSSPETAKEVEKQFQVVNQFVGTDVRQDLLGSMGSKLVVYQSPSEGFFFSGFVVLFEVKDEAKLRTALKNVVSHLGEAANVPTEVEQHEYHGARIHSVKVQTPGFFVRPSFTFHKGWLAVSLYPQPLKGLVLRGQGQLPGWKPSERTLSLVKAEMQPGVKLVGFTESDPRPTIGTLLGLAPLAGGFVASMGDFGFNPFLIPNAQMVNQHLFPNVFLTLEEEGRVRFESYTSINIPSMLNAEGLPQWGVMSLAAISFLGTRAHGTFREVGPALPGGPIPPPPPEDRFQPGGIRPTAPAIRRPAATLPNPRPPERKPPDR